MFERHSYKDANLYMPAKMRNARERIIKCGEAEFMKNGTSFSISRLMASCGVATGTFYSYFHSKDELILQLVDDDWDRIITEIDGLVGSSMPRLKKNKFIYDRIEAFVTKYRFARMKMRGPREYFIEHQDSAFNKMADKVEEVIKDDIDSGRAKINIPPAKAARLLVGMFVLVSKDPKLNFMDMYNFIESRE